jgi:hypothetical protein
VLQQQSRLRQEQQQNYLRQPGVLQHNYQHMLRMQQQQQQQQQGPGMQMSANEMRQRASQNNLRNVYVLCFPSALRRQLWS